MNKFNVLNIFRQRPLAAAKIHGSSAYPGLFGMVYFYRAMQGVIVAADISGLPTGQDKCRQPIFAFHIHEGGSCSGNAAEPFADTLGHFNPDGCPHPYHAGDMPPLFGCDGRALSAFMTNRFKASDIIGRTVVIHSGPDDFTTQPSGNSGEKIACGVIKTLR